MTTESRSQCSRCRGCTSSTRLRGRHRRRSHLMYHRRTSPSIHRPRRSRTCTNRRGDSCEGWAEARGPARGPSTRAGRDMAARADLRPVSGCDSCVRCCGPEKVPNSAAAARHGQSGMCTRHRDEDESSSIVSPRTKKQVSKGQLRIPADESLTSVQCIDTLDEPGPAPIHTYPTSITLDA